MHLKSYSNNQKKITGKKSIPKKNEEKLNVCLLPLLLFIHVHNKLLATWNAFHSKILKLLQEKGKKAAAATATTLNFLMCENEAFHLFASR